MTIVAAIKRHAVLIYFALVFVLSGGSILLIVGPEGFPLNAEEFASFGLLLYAAILAGPCVAGVLMTAIVDGRPGSPTPFRPIAPVAGRLDVVRNRAATRSPDDSNGSAAIPYISRFPSGHSRLQRQIRHPAGCLRTSPSGWLLRGDRLGKGSQSLSCGRAIPYSRPG